MSHVGDGCDFVAVGFDATLGHHVSEEFALGHTECAFLRIQLDVEFLEICKRSAQGGDQVVRARCFDDNVTNVDCDCCPRWVQPVGVDWRIDLVRKAGFNSSLVCCPYVLETERNRHIAV